MSWVWTTIYTGVGQGSFHSDLEVQRGAGNGGHPGLGLLIDVQPT